MTRAALACVALVAGLTSLACQPQLRSDLLLCLSLASIQAVPLRDNLSFEITQVSNLYRALEAVEKIARCR